MRCNIASWEQNSAGRPWSKLFTGWSRKKFIHFDWPVTKNNLAIIAPLIALYAFGGSFMASRILSLASIMLGLSCFGFCQQSACKAVEIPVGVMSVSGDVFRGLAAEDFLGHTLKKPVAVKALT